MGDPIGISQIIIITIICRLIMRMSEYMTESEARMINIEGLGYHVVMKL